MPLCQHFCTLPLLNFSATRLKLPRCCCLISTRSLCSLPLLDHMMPSSPVLSQVSDAVHFTFFICTIGHKLFPRAIGLPLDDWEAALPFSALVSIDILPCTSAEERIVTDPLSVQLSWFQTVACYRIFPT